MRSQSIIFMFIGVMGVLFLLLGNIVSSLAWAQGHTGHTAQPSAAGTEKPETVTPQIKQPAPQEEATEEAPQVEITPEQQQLIGVKKVKVSLKPLQKVIRTVGRIEADERKRATVNTKIEGWIEKLYVDYTGRYIKSGYPDNEGSTDTAQSRRPVKTPDVHECGNKDQLGKKACRPGISRD
jgi:hypothetical protein